MCVCEYIIVQTGIQQNPRSSLYTLEFKFVLVQITIPVSARFFPARTGILIYPWTNWNLPFSRKWNSVCLVGGFVVVVVVVVLQLKIRVNYNFINPLVVNM